MNDKIRELLKNAEKFDGLSFIKERIANREQLRKEKREKLKELMTNETKQTAVEWLESIIIDKNGIQMSDYFKFTFQQAKEMEKEQIIMAYKVDLYPCSDEDAEKYYNKTYGGNK